jgi:hypothetical protein
MIDVSGIVYITPDMYSTGDSPTDYEVELHSAISNATRKPISIRHLSKNDIEWVKEKATEQVNRNL